MAYFGWPWSDVAIAIALGNPTSASTCRAAGPGTCPGPPWSTSTYPSDGSLFETDYPILMQEEWVANFAEVGSGLKSGMAEELMKGKARRLLGD